MKGSVQNKDRNPASEVDENTEQERRSGDGQNDADEVRENVSGQMSNNADAADIALAAVDELADQAGELEMVRAELEETRDQLLRKAAEFQNYRRRTEEEKSTLVELGKSIVIQQFLDVLDDFRRSLEAAEKVKDQEGEAGPAYEALHEGVELVFKKFMDELSKHGVEPIEAVGEPFDESQHEAMMQREAEGAEPGTVVDELQKGYRMGDRVLRHSRVIVAS